MPMASCPECGTLRRNRTSGGSLIAQLQAELHELRVRLNSNSSNSSIPLRPIRLAAPKPVIKMLTGRKPGTTRAPRFISLLSAAGTGQRDRVVCAVLANSEHALAPPALATPSP